MPYFYFIHKIYCIFDIPTDNGCYYIKQACNTSKYKIYILEINNKQKTKKIIDNDIINIFDINDQKLYYRPSCTQIWMLYPYFNMEDVEKTVIIPLSVDTMYLNVTDIYYVSPQSQITYKYLDNNLVLDVTNITTGGYFLYYNILIQDNLFCPRYKIYTIYRNNLLYLRMITQTTTSIYLAYLNNIMINPSNNIPDSNDPGFVIGGSITQGDTVVKDIIWNTMTPYITSSGIFTAPHNGTYIINFIFSYAFEPSTLLSDGIPYIIIRQGSTYNTGNKLLTINITNVGINNGIQQQYRQTVSNTLNITTYNTLSMGDKISIEYHTNNSNGYLTLSPINSQSLLLITYNGP